MKRLLAGIGVLFLSFNLTANELDTFDLKTYHPENFGLTDLSCEIRIDNLLQQLNQLSIFGKLTDVYYKIYWTKDRGFALTIEGISDAFSVQKENLKELVIHRLEFIIPRSVAALAEGLTLSTARDKGDVIITATDPSGKKDPNKIVFTLGPDNNLKKVKIYATGFVSETEYHYGTIDGSMNKVVLLSSKADVQTIGSNPQRHFVETQIKYQLVGQVVVPQEVKIKTALIDAKYTFQTPAAAALGSGPKTMVENVITFSNYTANHRLASNFYQALDNAQYATPATASKTDASVLAPVKKKAKK